MHPQYTYTPRDILRFWRHLRRVGECWLYQGQPSQDYPQFKVWHRDGERVRECTHRAAWRIYFGPIPDGLSVLHRCDVLYAPGDTTYRRCVRPDHLFLGTPGDNMADMWAKGRGSRGPEHAAKMLDRPFGERNAAYTHPECRPRGESHGMAILTEDQVRAIRARYAAGGVRQRDLATQYGVAEPTIGAIIARRKWAHVA